MSLINDLVLEVDRRRSAGGKNGGPALEQLRPVRGRQRRLPASKSSRPDLLRPAVAIAALLCISVAAFKLHIQPDRLQAETGRILPGVSEQQAGGPAVGAAPGAVPALISSVAPARVRRILSEPATTGTRLRIEMDRRVDYEIRGAGLRRELQIVLDASVLEAPIGPLALRETPIRAFQALQQSGRLHLHLSLAEASPVQGQWLETRDAATLLIDIPSAGAAEKRARARAELATLQPRRAAPPKPQSSSPASVAARPDSEPEKAMAIAPSAADAERRRRERQRAQAEAIVASARSARSEADPSVAVQRYRSALEADPGNADIAFELTETLQEAGLREEALLQIDRMRAAGAHASKWVMLHARILAEHDLAKAVATLDAAGANPRHAPEVHAMAAAYAQRAGDHDDAARRYESLIRLYPGKASLWLGLGISLEAQGRPGEAGDAYRIALEMGGLPNASRSWITSRVADLAGKG